LVQERRPVRHLHPRKWRLWPDLDTACSSGRNRQRAGYHPIYIQLFVFISI